MLSSDNLCKQCGPRDQDRQSVGLDLIPNHNDTDYGIPERTFLKKLILKKVSRQLQKHAKLPSMHRV